MCTNGYCRMITVVNKKENECMKRNIPILSWLSKLLLLVYQRKKIKNNVSTIIKYKVLGITVYKEVRSYTRIEHTYLKWFCRTQRLPNLRANDANYALLDEPVVQDLPLVSVIVPNYNHAPFLKQRLDSIYRQTYAHYEVILLDDASTDESVDILREYADQHVRNTRLIVNDTNSGGVFHQWSKGLALAKGDYVWIAESDDYCDVDFLEKVVKGLDYQSVMISFARSVFMENGKKVWSTEEAFEDLPLAWDSEFMMPAHKLVNKGFGIKNLIVNVSSAVFRNVGTLPTEVVSAWERMSLCGDWLFYLWLIRGGCVYYTPATTNYYRIHKNSTSKRVQKTSHYYSEVKEVSCYIASHYAVDASLFEKEKELLVEHCKYEQDEESLAKLDQLYNLEEVENYAKERKPNIGMCVYSMSQGGGEVFPIYLANELKRLGYPVTCIDFRGGNYDPDIRKKLNKDVPLVELNDKRYLVSLIEAFGLDIIHSHETNVDCAVGESLGLVSCCKQVVTLHGAYECLSKNRFHAVLAVVTKSVSCFVYISDKNLIPFKHFFPSSRFKKIGNGLPVVPVIPHKRSELGIEEDAFCVTLVSRAMFEKGWLEAVEAVKMAVAHSVRPIHLILIGSGECYDYLCQATLPPYIHLLGRKGDVRNYFALSDAALLPSRFKGESFPLVIIEALMSGVPVIASNVGEVKNMLTDEQGRRAGILFDLVEGKVPTDELARIILRLSSDKGVYDDLRRNVSSLAQRFTITATAQKYIEVYQEVMHS